MSVQRIWDGKNDQFVWFDLSYFLGKKDIPDPRHGKPVVEEKDKNLPPPKKEEVK